MATGFMRNLRGVRPRTIFRSNPGASIHIEDSHDASRQGLTVQGRYFRLQVGIILLARFNCAVVHSVPSSA